jgi:hypothetical protein
MLLAGLVGIFALLASVGDGSCQDMSPTRANQVTSLIDRVVPPSQRAVDEFIRAGMKEVKAHSLTDSERAKVESALASLPELNKRVLQEHLHTLGFVDGIPGNGTGLTSRSEGPGQYDITLRASIIDEPLTDFLTIKERRVFVSDQSGMSVTIRATGVDALTYILLHESAHVVDDALGITSASPNSFAKGIWSSRYELVPKLRESLAAQTIFRGRPSLHMSQAIAVYKAVLRTPFVSLYATASTAEDFAELLAWHEIKFQHHGNLTVEIHDAHGKTLQSYHPLSNPKVRMRFSAVASLLASS